MWFPEQIIKRALELYQGCSATQALKGLKDEFPKQDMPTDRTIRRWHNKKLLKEHLEQMAGIAESLIKGFGEVRQRPKRGDQNDIFEYMYSVDGFGRGVTREKLGSMFSAHVETVIEQDSHEDWKSFLQHIIEEFPVIERIGLAWFAKDNPYELLQTLKKMAVEK